MKRAFVLFYLFLLIANCNHEIDSSKVYSHIISLIAFMKSDIDRLCDRIDQQHRIIQFPEANKYPAMGMVETKEMAIELAMVFVKERAKEKITRYLPLFSYRYRRIWFVYGCKDIANAIRTNWQNLDEWDSIIILINSDTAAVEAIECIIK